MRENYETVYGICNHNDPTVIDNSLSSMLTHPAENLLLIGLLQERMDDYIQAGIRETFGLSWNEFIDNPRYVVEMLIIAGKKYTNRRNKDIEKDLDGLGGRKP